MRRTLRAQLRADSEPLQFSRIGAARTVARVGHRRDSRGRPALLDPGWTACAAFMDRSLTDLRNSRGVNQSTHAAYTTRGGSRARAPGTRRVSTRAAKKDMTKKSPQAREDELVRFAAVRVPEHVCGRPGAFLTAPQRAVLYIEARECHACKACEEAAQVCMRPGADPLSWIEGVFRGLEHRGAVHGAGEDRLAAAGVAPEFHAWARDLAHIAGRHGPRMKSPEWHVSAREALAPLLRTDTRVVDPSHLECALMEAVFIVALGVASHVLVVGLPASVAQGRVQSAQTLLEMAARCSQRPTGQPRPGLGTLPRIFGTTLIPSRFPWAVPLGPPGVAALCSEADERFFYSVLDATYCRPQQIIRTAAVDDFFLNRAETEWVAERYSAHSQCVY